MKTSPHLKPLFFALVASNFVAGCSSDGGDWIPLLEAARESWDGRDAAVSLKDAGAIPYATLGLRLDGGREQILVLATDTHGERLWTSAAHISLVTSQGRIVKTFGLDADVTARSSLPDGAGWTHPHSYTWVGDFPDLGLYSAAVTCDLGPANHDSITILGKSFDTVRVDEQCRSAALDWAFVNSYWVNADSGQVWRSIQHVHPKGQTLEIEILRPPVTF